MGGGCPYSQLEGQPEWVQPVGNGIITQYAIKKLRYVVQVGTPLELHFKVCPDAPAARFTHVVPL